MTENSKDKIATFIVRVWCEPREMQGAAPLVRGVVEHVPGGGRQYFQELEKLVLFIHAHAGELCSGSDEPGTIKESR